MKVKLHHSTGQTEEKHEKLQSRYSVSWRVSKPVPYERKCRALTLHQPAGSDCPCPPVECEMFSNSLPFPRGGKPAASRENISSEKLKKKRNTKRTIMNNVYKCSLNKITWSATLIVYTQKATSEIGPGIKRM